MNCFFCLFVSSYSSSSSCSSFILLIFFSSSSSSYPPLLFPLLLALFLLILGSNQNDPTLVDVLLSKSKNFVEQLLEELGISLTDIVNSGGHSVARTHKPANWPIGNTQPIGALLVNQVFILFNSHFKFN